MKVLLVVIVITVLVIGVWFILMYNRFVALRKHLAATWADLDTELQRRYDLVPNLVETVKGYAAHESQLLRDVTAARAQAMADSRNPTSLSGDERSLIRQLSKLQLTAEAYPDLKADSQFLKLQQELVNTEDRIAAARRFYNGTVRELNTMRRSFPPNLVAAITGVKAADYFEIDDHSHRELPRIDVSP